MIKITTMASLIAVAAMATMSAQTAFAQGGLLDRGKDLLNNSGNSGGTQGALDGVTGVGEDPFNVHGDENFVLHDQDSLGHSSFLSPRADLPA